METPTAFCGFWSLAPGPAHIQKPLLNCKMWKGQMQDSLAQDQLFMVLLVLRSPHSQEGHGLTSGSIPFCAMPPGQTALAKVTQSRGKSSVEYVLQLQRHQFYKDISSLSVSTVFEPAAISVPSPFHQHLVGCCG